MKIAIFLDLVPQEYIEITKKTTILSIKKFLEKYNNIEKIRFFVNDKTESKLFKTDKYNKYNLSSIWKDFKNPAIYLYTPDQLKKLPKDFTKYELMMRFDDKSLLSFCQTSSLGRELCKDERFWELRFINKFGKIASEYKPETRSWRNHYLKVITDLDVYSEDPWKIFDIISWDISNEPDMETVMVLDKDVLGGESLKIHRIKDARESINNVYWLLNLGKEIKIAYPQDRYQDLEPEIKTYKSEKDFTPAEVLKLIFDYYDSPITKKELQELKDQDVDYANEYTLEDAEMGEVTRYNIIEGLSFFEGFTKLFDEELFDEDKFKNIKFLRLGS